MRGGWGNCFGADGADEVETTRIGSSAKDGASRVGGVKLYGTEWQRTAVRVSRCPVQRLSRAKRFLGSAAQLSMDER